MRRSHQRPARFRQFRRRVREKAGNGRDPVGIAPSAREYAGHHRRFLRSQGRPRPARPALCATTRPSGCARTRNAAGRRWLTQPPCPPRCSDPMRKRLHRADTVETPRQDQIEPVQQRRRHAARQTPRRPFPGRGVNIGQHQQDGAEHAMAQISAGGRSSPVSTAIVGWNRSRNACRSGSRSSGSGADSVPGGKPDRSGVLACPVTMNRSPGRACVICRARCARLRSGVARVA